MSLGPLSLRGFCRDAFCAPRSPRRPSAEPGYSPPRHGPDRDPDTLTKAQGETRLPRLEDNHAFEGAPRRSTAMGHAEADGADCTNRPGARPGRAARGGIGLMGTRAGSPSLTRPANSCSTVADHLRAVGGEEDGRLTGRTADHVAWSDQGIGRERPRPRGPDATFVEGQLHCSRRASAAFTSYSARRISASTSWACNSARGAGPPHAQEPPFPGSSLH